MFAKPGLPAITPRDIALPKAAETQAAVDQGKAKAEQIIAKNAGQQGDSKPSGGSTKTFSWGGGAHIDPYGEMAGVKSGASRSAPGATVTRSETPRAAARAPMSLNTFVPTDDPWGIPDTGAQMAQDLAAHELINARHRQAVQAIDERAAERPDPMGEAILRARGNAEFAHAAGLAEDPYADERAKAQIAGEGQVKTYQGIQGVLERQKTQERQAYSNEVNLRIQQAERKKAEIAARPGMNAKDRKDQQDGVDALLQQQIDEIGQKYGFAQKAAADPYAGVAVGAPRR